MLLSVAVVAKFTVCRTLISRTLSSTVNTVQFSVYLQSALWTFTAFSAAHDRWVNISFLVNLALFCYSTAPIFPYSCGGCSDSISPYQLPRLLEDICTLKSHISSLVYFPSCHLFCSAPLTYLLVPALTVVQSLQASPPRDLRCLVREHGSLQAICSLAEAAPGMSRATALLWCRAM